MKYDEKPQYAYYLSTFSKVLEKNNLIDDKMFDWMFLEDEESNLELNHRFDLYEGEDELVKKISKELEEKESENVEVHRNIHIPEGMSKQKLKGEKECAIY